MLRLNLAQSLARRGIRVDIVTPSGTSDPSQTRHDTEELDDALQFSVLLRRCRVEAGLSQEELAERARISVNGLSALERGIRRTPRRETLALLAEALALTGAKRAAFENAAGRATKTLEAQSGATCEPTSSTDVNFSEIDLLVIVSTPAWLADATCLDHLERFRSARDDRGVDGRVLIVRRDPFVPDSTIDALSGRSSFDFFRNATRTRPFEALYRNDGTPAAAFYDVVDSLAQAVYRHVASDGRNVVTRAGVPRFAIYVAPPARDMEGSYRTLVAELEASGYVVVPTPTNDASEGRLSDEIDFELTTALTSIHLLGDEDDFDEAGRSRVAYPLARAAARASASNGAFHRILFAPKLFAPTQDAPALERDPIGVRDRFAEPLASDTIVGDGITDFVLAVKDLIRAVERRAQSQTEAVGISAGSTVFVNFHPGDLQYACSVAKALRERGLRARFAAFEDDNVQNRITNAGLVRESEAVIHCWANATDAWLYAEAADYEDWRKFGRSQPFLARAAVAGPPERGSKMLYTAHDPPEAIDVYIDLTARDTPLASDLDPIVATVTEPRYP